MSQELPQVPPKWLQFFCFIRGFQSYESCLDASVSPLSVSSRHLTAVLPKASVNQKYLHFLALEASQLTPKYKVSSPCF